MSRLMSVAYTADAVLERRKTVTRRLGWWEDKNGRRLLHVGDQLTLCRKVMGRKPGEPLERLANVEVLEVWRESLAWLTDATKPEAEEWLRSNAALEMSREGFPGLDPAEFVRRYFVDAQRIQADASVTRIEWRYLETETP